MAAAELTPTRSSSATTEEREVSRKEIFKKKGCPNWRNTYRERCANRLKRNRLLLFDQNREHSNSPLQENVTESVHAVMQEEWNQLRSEIELPNVTIGRKRHALSPMIGNNSPKRQSHPRMGVGREFITPPRQIGVCHVPTFNEGEPEDEIEYLLTLMDDITQELIDEEQSIITAQYEDNLRYSEEALSSAIDSLTQDDNAIICPICLKSVLVQENQFIYCKCGLTIDTEQDGISLDYVRTQLTQGTELHSEHCIAVPVFKTDGGVLGLQNLVMTCSPNNECYVCPTGLRFLIYYSINKFTPSFCLTL